MQAKEKLFKTLFKTLTTITQILNTSKLFLKIILKDTNH